MTTDNQNPFALERLDDDTQAALDRLAARTTMTDTGRAAQALRNAYDMGRRAELARWVDVLDNFEKLATDDIESLVADSDVTLRELGDHRDRGRQ